MSKPLLCLCMIVRDEEHTLAKTFASVRGVVDRWRILDTGSTDKTCNVVENALATEEGPRIPCEGGGDKMASLTGHLHEVLFVDYSTSRNLALDLEEKASQGRHVHLAEEDPAVWALSLSADETLHNGEHLRAFLQSFDGEETALMVEVRTPTGAFNYPRVLRVGGPWRYENELHEVPIHQSERTREPVVKIPGCWIEYRPSDPERFGRRLRERDVPLLEKQLAAAKAAHDSAVRARVVSLLAQTREQIAATIQDDVLSASQEMFIALGYYAFLSMDSDAPAAARQNASWKYLNVAELLGIHIPSEMVLRLQHAQKSDPENPAIAYMLARHTANIGEDGVVRGNPREGMHAAQKAAKLAHDAVKDKSKPHDPHGLLWRPHFIAAVCAKALGHGPAARKSAEAGISSGGPTDIFSVFLS